MKYMKVGIIQQCNNEDVKSNIIRLVSKIRECAEKSAELIVLQELHNNLYFCQNENVDFFDLAETIPGMSTEIYRDMAKECKVVIITSLFEKRAPGIYHNTAVVFEKDGSIAGKYRKMHIPDDPAYYEKFYFTPGDTGFEPIKTSVGTLGVLVCWDQWFPEAARLMALKGADLLIYPTAIGWERTDSEDEKKRQQDAWQTVQRGHAIANSLHVITVNRVGYEPDPADKGNGIQFWGHSFIAGPQGEIIHQSPEDKEDIKIIEIDLERKEQVRRWWPFFRDRRTDAYQEILKRWI
jgi:N-carbamoylputrescine amidase